MANLFVLDTCAIISYFQNVFNEPPSISSKSLRLIEKAFTYSEIKMIVPSIVFIELYKLYFNSEETAKKISYEVFFPIKEAVNFEIRSFDRDALIKFIAIIDIEQNHKFDNHDKQILAVAMDMNCPLVTSDNRIIRYNGRKGVIPEILN